MCAAAAGLFVARAASKTVRGLTADAPPVFDTEGIANSGTCNPLADGAVLLRIVGVTLVALVKVTTLCKRLFNLKSSRSFAELRLMIIFWCSDREAS